MSQIYRSTTSGPPPPDVATTYVTDVNSPAVPAANILEVLGIDTEANNIRGIQTDGSSGSNVLTVQLTNRLRGDISVIGATTGDIITFDLGGSVAVYRVYFLVTGRDVATGDGVGYTVDASARTDGAGAAIISTANIDADEDPSLTGALIDVVASGNDLIVRLTGVAGQTISYSAFGYYIVI